MEKKTIRKSIDIPAPREHVWEVLLNDKYLRIWSACFSEGSHADTDWQVGSKAVFTDSTNNGIFGRVIVNKPYEALSVEFDGMILNGKEDMESNDARQVKGGRETYLLSDKDGITHLAIESNMPERHFDAMSHAWDKAIQKIKELAVSLTEKVI